MMWKEGEKEGDPEPPARSPEGVALQESHVAGKDLKTPAIVDDLAEMPLFPR